MWSSDSEEKNTIPRAYYQGSYKEFLSANEAEIYRELVHNSLQFDLTVQQEQALQKARRLHYRRTQKIRAEQQGLLYVFL